MFKLFSRGGSAIPANTSFLRAAKIAAVGLGFALVAPLGAFASGGGGGGYSGAGSAGVPTPAPRQVDEVYEFGKSIYLGRAPGSQKIKYCVKVDGETKKLRGRTLRQYKGSKQVDFANALYNCEAPEERALLKIKREEVAYVLYYLNKRYKLDLQS